MAYIINREKDIYYQTKKCDGFGLCSPITTRSELLNTRKIDNHNSIEVSRRNPYRRKSGRMKLPICTIMEEEDLYQDFSKHQL